MYQICFPLQTCVSAAYFGRSSECEYETLCVCVCMQFIKYKSKEPHIWMKIARDHDYKTRIKRHNFIRVTLDFILFTVTSKTLYSGLYPFNGDVFFLPTSHKCGMVWCCNKDSLFRSTRANTHNNNVEMFVDDVGEVEKQPREISTFQTRDWMEIERECVRERGKEKERERKRLT